MIGLRPPKAHSKAQRHQCSKIKIGARCSIFVAPSRPTSGHERKFRDTPRRKALPLYQQTRPLKEQRRRWLAIALSLAPFSKILAVPAGSGCDDGQTTARG